MKRAEVIKYYWEVLEHERDLLEAACQEPNAHKPLIRKLLKGTENDGPLDLPDSRLSLELINSAFNELSQDRRRKTILDFLVQVLLPMSGTVCSSPAYEGMPVANQVFSCEDAEQYFGLTYYQVRERRHRGQRRIKVYHHKMVHHLQYKNFMPNVQP